MEMLKNKLNNPFFDDTDGNNKDVINTLDIYYPKLSSIKMENVIQNSLIRMII